MSKINMRFVRFLEKQQPDHLRLCYVYSDTIDKNDAVIMRFDSEAQTFFYLNDEGWLEDEDFEGLCWAHLPLPSEYKDERQ